MAASTSAAIAAYGSTTSSTPTERPEASATTGWNTRMPGESPSRMVTWASPEAAARKADGGRHGRRLGGAVRGRTPEEVSRSAATSPSSAKTTAPLKSCSRSRSTEPRKMARSVARWSRASSWVLSPAVRSEPSKTPKRA